MPVLILAIASYLIFFLVLLLLWVAGIVESRGMRNRHLLVLHNPLPLLSITQAFEPAHAVLWEGPVTALRLVEASGVSGVPVVRLRPVFRKCAARFPEIYDGYSFLDWVQFLEQTELIAWDGYRIKLTAEGVAFLKYRFTTDSLLEA